MGGLVKQLQEESFDDEEFISVVLTPIRTSREAGQTRSDNIVVDRSSLQIKQQDQVPINVEKVVLDDQDEDHKYNCVTPTTEAAILKPALVCPPAPRKKKLPTVLKRRKLPELEPHDLPNFFVDVPEDLESCFIPIIRNIAVKKIRVV